MRWGTVAAGVIALVGVASSAQAQAFAPTGPNTPVPPPDVEPAFGVPRKPRKVVEVDEDGDRVRRRPAKRRPRRPPGPGMDPPPPPTGVGPTCAASPACHRHGACTDAGGSCIVASDADCQRGLPCAYGRCFAHQGRCLARSPRDCEVSWACREHGLCRFLAYGCYPGADSPSFRPASGDEPPPRYGPDAARKKKPPKEGTGPFVSGIVLTSVGGAGILVGAVGGVLCGLSNFGGGGSDCGWVAAPLIGGGVSLAIGIPLLVAGKRARNASSLAPASLRVGVGPNGLSLRGAF